MLCRLIECRNRGAIGWTRAMLEAGATVIPDRV